MTKGLQVKRAEHLEVQQQQKLTKKTQKHPIKAVSQLLKQLQTSH